MAFHIKRKHDLKISTMFSSEKCCKSVFQEGSVRSHLAAVRVKIYSVRDQGVFASYFFGGGLNMKKKQNLFISGRSTRVREDVRSGNDQHNRSDRKMMLFTWKTIKSL